MIETAEPRTNQVWVEEISSSDPRCGPALAELRSILVAGLRRAFQSLGQDSPLIEDAAQEALLRIRLQIHSFRGDSRFVTWAMSIAVRIAITEVRRVRWRDVSLDEMVDTGRMPCAGSEADSNENYDYAELMRVVQRTIENNLTKRQREAIQAELAGSPPEVIAERLGSNRNAVYKLVYDARARLKGAILATGWSVEDIRRVLSGK